MTMTLTEMVPMIGTYLGIPILIQEDVLQLQVPMANVVLVAVVDGGGDLPENPPSL